MNGSIFFKPGGLQFFQNQATGGPHGFKRLGRTLGRDIVGWVVVYIVVRVVQTSIIGRDLPELHYHYRLEWKYRLEWNSA